MSCKNYIPSTTTKLRALAYMASRSQDSFMPICELADYLYAPCSDDASRQTMSTHNTKARNILDGMADGGLVDVNKVWGSRTYKLSAFGRDLYEVLKKHGRIETEETYLCD